VAHENSTFGKTSVGGLSSSYPANKKRVSRYALPSAGSIIKLSVYLAPTRTSGRQLLAGVIYGDSGSAPAALFGVTEQLTFTSSSSAGWYDLVLSPALKLSGGNYWIGVIAGARAKVAGFRYDRVGRSSDFNVNPFASGPSNPFGAATRSSYQPSLYATYTPS
jgi:hypothetical protein